MFHIILNQPFREDDLFGDDLDYSLSRINLRRTNGVLSSPVPVSSEKLIYGSIRHPSGPYMLAIIEYRF
jgi:hypothetical protein